MNPELDRPLGHGAAPKGMAQLVDAAHGYLMRWGVAALAREIATEGDNAYSRHLRDRLKARTILAARSAVVRHPALADEIFNFAAADEMSRGGGDTAWLRLPRERRQEAVAMFVATAVTHECLLQARQASTTHPDPKEVMQ